MQVYYVTRASHPLWYTFPWLHRLCLRSVCFYSDHRAVIATQQFDNSLTCFLKNINNFDGFYCVYFTFNHHPKCFGGGVVQFERFHFHCKFSFFCHQKENKMTIEVLRSALKCICIWLFLLYIRTFSTGIIYAKEVNHAIKWAAYGTVLALR